MDIRIKRGQILKDLRKRRGLTQTDISKLLEISQQAYQRYETGISEPNSDGLTTLANFYGVTVDYLLARDVNEDTLIQQMEELPPEYQEILTTVLHMLHNVDKKRKEAGAKKNQT